MKNIQKKLTPIFLISLFSALSPLHITHAATPYNALARTLPSNTTEGVYNPDSDQIKKDTSVSGIVWGVNGSTFIIRLPDDDAGYNVLFSKETDFLLNGNSTTSRSLTKGKAVRVFGNLDESTYTFSATRVELGVSPSSDNAPDVTPSPAVAVATPNIPETLSIDTLIARAKQGTRSTDAKRLQTELIAQGFLAPAYGTGYYGSLTAKAVRAYQATQKSPSPTTEPKVKTDVSGHVTSNLRQGNKGEEVKLLQQKLIALGLLESHYGTGYYGSLTTRAVKAFQKSHKLSQVGFVGPQTRALLNQ